MGCNEQILSVSPSGWATFTYKDIDAAGISYLCDPHLDISDGLARLISTGQPSIVVFDFEGKNAYLAITDDGLTYITDDGVVHEPMGSDEMIRFATSFVDELESNADDWIASWVGLDDEEYAEAARADLQDSIDVLRCEIREATDIYR